MSERSVMTALSSRFRLDITRQTVQPAPLALTTARYIYFLERSNLDHRGGEGLSGHRAVVGFYVETRIASNHETME